MGLLRSRSASTVTVKKSKFGGHSCKNLAMPAENRKETNMAGYILYSSPDEEKNEELEVLEEQIKEEEDGLREEYRKLGEAYFEKNKTDLYVPTEFSELFDAIKERESALKQYKERIMSLKKVKICPYCNSEIPQESVFCIMCGKKVQETKQQNLENTVTCKYCGTVLPAGSKFCGYCAHSLSDSIDLEEDTAIENTENETVEANLFNEETAEKESLKNDPFEDEFSKDTEAGYDEENDIETYDINTEDEIDDEEDDLYATTAANTGWNAIKICPRCNKKLDSSSKFCTGCGMRLSD